MSSQCGTGQFYCGTTDDGKVFDSINERHQRASHDALIRRNTLVQQKQVLLERRDECIASGVSPTAFASSKEVQAHKTAMSEMYQEQVKFEQDAASWFRVKMLAKSHYDSQRSRQQQGLALAPSFASFLEGFHPQVYVRVCKDGDSEDSDEDMVHDVHFSTSTGTIPAPSHHAMVPVAHNAPSQSSSVHHEGRFAPGSPGYSFEQNPLRSVMNSAPDIQQNESLEGLSATPMEPATLRARQLAAQDAIPEVRAHQQKRAKAKERTVEVPSSPEKSSDGVRRSTRVRDKQVNYVVDNISEQSRSPSPEKSEASAFSPETSDTSYNPGRGRSNGKKESSSLRDSVLGRSKTLLVDQIGDWKRNDHRAASPHTPATVSKTQMKSRKRAAESDVHLQPPRTRVKQESTTSRHALNPTSELPEDLGQTRRTSGHRAASFHAGPQVIQAATRPDRTQRPTTAPTPPYGRGSIMTGAQEFSVGLGIMTPESAMPNPLAARTLSRSFTMPMTQAAQQRHLSATYLAAPVANQSYQQLVYPPLREQRVQEQVMANELQSGPDIALDNYSWPELDWTLVDEEAMA
ncbi:hypothetical protein Slin15195_G078720 [Septoria linicola]|uniref:Uncharacterized protein n=1 Tax=Septoria linicola TaxID=215465 RepID=A0A9Q9AYU5_9PEZI|nr:hypothetical protein Slin14017_G039920 [Septoria linicola]USW54553.1 hypothetical protein Slin15195_G078720 [Septoria linicola]